MPKFYLESVLLSALIVCCSPAAAEQPAAPQTAGVGGQSFSEYAKQNATADGNGGQNATDNNQNGNAAQENKTWINNLVDKVTEKSSSVLGNASQVQTQKRSNASVFDISGIMLRMDLSQVNEAMQRRGYKKISEHLEIPNFIRWRYEEQCRNSGVVGYERLGNCVILMAKKNNYQYVQQVEYGNFHTQESISVFFTSNFTGNKVYRILYRTEAANVKGSGAKADYLRNIKIFDFWKKINQKYGVPDNREQVLWGMGDNKPSLQAKTGQLVLYDPMLLELDYTRMSREDQKFMNTAVYTF